MARPKTTHDKLKQLSSEAYQVIGALAGYTGTFDHPDVQAALDRFSNPDSDSDSSGLLPWPKTPIVNNRDVERRREAVGALRAVLGRINTHVAEHWLMGEPHPPMMTLGEYLRAAIERAERGD